MITGIGALGCLEHRSLEPMYKYTPRYSTFRVANRFYFAKVTERKGRVCRDENSFSETRERKREGDILGTRVCRDGKTIFHSYPSRNDSIMLDAEILRLMNFVGCAEYRFLRAPRSTLVSLTFRRRTRRPRRPSPRWLPDTCPSTRYLLPPSFPSLSFPFLSFHLTRAVSQRETSRPPRVPSIRRDQLPANLFLLSFYATRLDSTRSTLHSTPLRFAPLHVPTKSGTDVAEFYVAR